MNDMRLLVWEPSIYLSKLECRGCNNDIPAKSPFFILEPEIKWLLPHESAYQAYSVRCAGCGLLELMQNNFSSMFLEAIKNYSIPIPYDVYNEAPIAKSVKQIVRQELQQILKEEAFDPNGPFSPAP